MARSRVAVLVGLSLLIGAPSLQVPWSPHYLLCGPSSKITASQWLPAPPNAKVASNRPARRAGARRHRNIIFTSASHDVSNAATDEQGTFSWSSSWFPIAYAAYTDEKRPTKHFLLGAPVVLWKSQGIWHAALDKCPHRLAPLSEGRVVPSTGDIECPYHGFTFDGTSGRCTGVPQSDDPTNVAHLPGIATRGCATVLPCRIQQGIIWVHSAPLYGNFTADANPDELLRYRIEPLEDQGVLYSDYFRDLPMEWSTLAENVLDPAHLPFTHHKTISSRSQARPVPLILKKPIAASGIEADRETDPPGAVEFRAPHLILAETRRKHSFTDWNVAYAIPTLPGRCRLLVRVVFQVSAMKPPLKWIFSIVFRLPAFSLHMSNHKILEDDNIFLHNQGHNYRSLKNVQDGTYLPTAADAVVAAFHKWLMKYESCRTWSAHTLHGDFLARDKVLTRSELIDRGCTHTESCRSCLAARKLLGRLELSLALGVILCAMRLLSRTSSSGPKWPMGLLAVVLYVLKRKTRGMQASMETGTWPPPRNKD